MYCLSNVLYQNEVKHVQKKEAVAFLQKHRFKAPILHEKHSMPGQLHSWKKVRQPGSHLATVAYTSITLWRGIHFKYDGLY